jgi:hypothetical protein
MEQQWGSENRVGRGILGPKKKEDRENWMMRSFITYMLHQVSLH